MQSKLKAQLETCHAYRVETEIKLKFWQSQFYDELEPIF